MKEKALTVEFPLPPTQTPPSPKPPPGAKAERQRQERAARKARNLALAYWIDSLIRSGEAEDLAAVAHMCGVSRSRVSQVMEMLGIRSKAQGRFLSGSLSKIRPEHMAKDSESPASGLGLNPAFRPRGPRRCLRQTVLDNMLPGRQDAPVLPIELAGTPKQEGCIALGIRNPSPHFGHAKEPMRASRENDHA